MSNPRPKLRRTLSMLILGSAVVVFGLAALVLTGYLLWSAHQIDQSMIERQRLRVIQALKSQLQEVARDQESVAIRDDTLLAVRRGDETWLEVNVGSWMYTYFGYDDAYIVAPGGAVLFAARDGIVQHAPGAALDVYRPALDPLLAEVRQRASQGYLDTPPHAADYVMVDGTPAIVSAIPLISDSGRIAQRPGQEPILVTIVRLELDYELRMIERYQTEVGRYTTSPTANNGLEVQPISNREGRIVAFYEWIPYRPGAELLARTGPALVITFIVVAALLGALVNRLWGALNALELRRLEAERQAGHDSLTGLRNRLSFEQLFDEQLANRNPRDPLVTLLMLDLDRFKQVNDTLGHSAGDDLLRAVADRLRDLIGPADTLARLGGDEFAILHPCIAGQLEVTELAQRVIEALARPFRVQGNDAFVGVSIGIVIASGEADSHELNRRADIALYEAKAAGRNRYVVYRETMDEEVQNRHTIEAELREALRAPGQLWVAYQPLWNARDQIIGAEALLRWSHPTRGDVPPASFIGIAESCGLIEPLGEFILRRACQFGARWPGITVAVNISPVQLRNPKFVDQVFGILAETGMRHADLEIEITEGILLDDQTVASRSIRALRSAGIRVALDDFGTGYSSLNYLKRYPVDRIKIDRSFVSQLTGSSGTEAIVEALITLARALGIEVTAEGVETPDQFAILLAMGCGTFQGYLFSRPLSVADIEALLVTLPRPVEVA